MSEANENKNKNLLKSVSIDLLYDGMLVEDDIYDSTGDRLLITSGNTIDDVHIERIKRLNSGSTTIYVTGRTHKAMLSKKPKNIEIENRQEVEDSIGYTTTKDQTFELLAEMASTKTVNIDSLDTVSQELTHQLESTPPTVIISLINAMAPIDEYLQRHSANVGLLNGLIGRWMGASDTDVDRLVLVGLLHDCGKTLIPPRILNAPRKLTVTEYEVIKKHADYTYDLLADFPEAIRVAAGSHHERIDGSGYPKGLSNDEIALGARITAISDTYDAMVSQRAYRNPQSPFSVLSLLEKQSQDLLDGEVVHIFKKNMPSHLMNKPVIMSDGTIGIVRKYDPSNIEYPTVEVQGRTMKSNKDLYIVSMYSDE